MELGDLVRPKPSNANLIHILRDNLIALLLEAFTAGSTSPYDCKDQEVERLLLTAKNSSTPPQSGLKKYSSLVDIHNKWGEQERAEGILAKASTIDDLVDITCPSCNKAELIEHRSGNSLGMIFTTLLCPRCGWGPNVSFQEMLKGIKS